MSATPPGSFPGYNPDPGQPANEPPPAPADQYHNPSSPGGYQPPPGGYQPPNWPPAEPPAQPAQNPYPPQPAYQPPPPQSAPPTYPPQSAPPTYPPQGAPPGQPQYPAPAPARHLSGNDQPGSPYTQQWPPNNAAPAQAPPPNNLPYGGVPGMVLPANYPGYGVNTTTHRELGIVGLVITVIGAAMVVASFTVLNWLSGDDGFGGTATIKFSDLHDAVTSEAPVVPRLYFNWLGWALLAATVVIAVLGNLPTRSHALWRLVGAVIGIAGAILTFLAIYNDGTSFSDVFKYGGVGFWLAIAGFVVAAVGALVGPRRVRG